jgi:hypothetical protein
MGLFGLGSFGEGFVKGFATEANEALKRDIERINTRVEKVADFQVQKSIKEQDKRKDELEDIEEAIAEGESLFGTGPEATQFAAALLKQQGSISAYRSMIETMKNRSLSTGETDFRKYLTSTGDVQVPITEDGIKPVIPSRAEFAADFLGKPKATKPYDLPADAASAGAGNLLGSLGFNVDISSKITETVKQDLAARGLLQSDSDVPLAIIPSLSFDSEAFTVDGMDTSQKLKFYNDKLANPANKNKREFYQSKITGIETSILATGGIDDKITVLKTRMSKEEGNVAAATAKEIARLNRDKTLLEAQGSGDRMSILEAQASIALADAYDVAEKSVGTEDEKDPDLSGYRDIVQEIADIKSEPTFAEIVSREEDDFASDVKFGRLVEGTNEYNTRLASLNENIRISKLIPKDKKLKQNVVTNFMSQMKDAITADIAKDMSPNDFKIFYDLQATVEKNPNAYAQSFTDDQRKIYDEGIARTQEIRKGAVERVLSGLSETGGFEEYPEAWYAANNLGFPGMLGQAETEKAAASVATDDTAATSVETQTDAALSPKKPVVVTEALKTKYFSQFPNTAEGANAYVKSLTDDGVPLDTVLNDPEVLAVYGPKFKARLKSFAGTDVNMALMAMESGIDYEAEEEKNLASRNSKIDDIVDRFHNPAFSKIFVAQPSKVNRLIREELGLENTPENKQLVSKLIEESALRLSPTKTTGEKRGDRRAKGGLMARK